jgi:hypothetical protein
MRLGWRGDVNKIGPAVIEHFMRVGITPGDAHPNRELLDRQRLTITDRDRLTPTGCPHLFNVAICNFAAANACNLQHASFINKYPV